VWWHLLIAAVAFLIVLRSGLWLLRLVAREPPPPPPAGELRRVNARFRCSVCGMEMRVMLAPDQDPEPPRHCMEEMDLMRVPE